MNHIILSEGKHDTEFLENLIKEYHSGWEIDRLDIESQELDTRIPRETNKIQQFKGQWSNKDILIKSEGGRPNLLSAIPPLLKQYANKRVSFDILVDLDNDDMDYFVRKINSTFHGRSAGRIVQIEPIDDSETIGNVIIQDFRLKSDERVMDDFNIIALDPCLEDIAGVSDSDSGSEINSKIERLAQDPRISRPIIETLF